MQMFREVADIQTADMLKLPVPKVNYRNIKVAPSEIQTEMVASLAKRAEKVRDRLVEPYIDNMLKITNALNTLRTRQLQEERPTEPVDELISKVAHAPTKKFKVVHCRCNEER